MINNENIMGLQLVSGVGRKTILKLIEYLGQKECSSYEIKDYINIIEEEILFKNLIYDLDEINAKIEKSLYVCNKNDIEIISILDDNYPIKLRENEDKPVLLYIQGNKEMLDEYNNIAVIGTRNPSRKGYEIGSFLSERLAKEGYNVISGLALGCDTAGHRGCLLGKGKTAAIIPSGHEYVYPRVNKGLYYQILQNNGAIVSELPPLSKPMKHDFVDRDRLQAAFSDAILVIESELNSGTVYTVNYGLKYGKIIGCSGHDNSEKSSKLKLNRKLINNKIAYKISSFNDLIAFAEKLKDKRVMVCQS